MTSRSRPGSDPAQAELEFNGAKQLELKDGALVIQGESGSVRLEAPRVYQEIAGRQQPVEGSFVLRGGNRAGFAIGSYDHSRELVIDPILTFSTYFGGSGDEALDLRCGRWKLQHLPYGFDDLAESSAAAGMLFRRRCHGARRTSMLPRLRRRWVRLSRDPGLCDLSGRRRNGLPGRNQGRWRGDPYVAGTTTSTNFPTTATGVIRPIRSARARTYS